MVNDMSEHAINYDITTDPAPPPPPAPAGPRIKRREVWVALSNEYEGFQIKIWVNAPTKLWMSLGSGDEEENREIAAKLFLAHNGWLDFDGNPYPQPNNAEFWEEIPQELAGVIIASAQKEMQNLPNSVAPKRRRSKRG